MVEMPLDHQVPIRLHVVGGSRAPSKVGAVAPTTSAMLKSADEVMQSNLELCTPSNVRPLTKKLASEAFFGEDVLLQSTVTGKAGQHALDEHKLQTLQTVIRNKIFPELTVECFKEVIWPQMKDALGELCKGLRRKYKDT